MERSAPAAGRRGTGSRRCPLCGGPAYPWIAIPLPGVPASVGLASPVDPDDPDAGRHARLLDRCEDCGSGIQQGPEPDLEAELDLITVARDGEDRTLIAHNRRSWQAGIGGDSWAALAEWEGRLLMTPRGMECLLERTGMEGGKPSYPPWGKNQRWMWQTLLNGLTLHQNFATDVLAGRLNRRNARGLVSFFADTIASTLAAPLVALVSLPLEIVAALAGRGGRMVVHARPRS